MPRSRATFIVPFLLLAGLLSPAPAAASSAFTQQWSLAGWDFVQDVGNTDGDSQRELLFTNKVDGHLALVDGLTGTIAEEFPQFTINSLMTAVDVDGDGRLEVFFWRPANGPVTYLVTGYDWDGANYATLFSHTDPTDYWGLLNLRSATTYDAIEFSGTDVRVRDLSGTVIFRASTAIAGWSGDAPSVVTLDIDEDGILELGAVEHNFQPTVKVHFFNYAGGFTPAWTSTGWQLLGAVHSDGDPQPEIVMAQGTDGHYALFDGISGAMEMEFPGFSFYQSANITAVDVDGDGPEELFLWRQENLPTTRLFTAYKWSAGNYTTTFSHTEIVDNFSLGHFRSPAAYDFLETNSDPHPEEVRVRDLAGNVVFRASTQIPGWSGADTYTFEQDMDGDGLTDLVIQDNATLRSVRYSGGTFVQEWSTSAWSMQGALNADGDVPSELVVTSAADQHFALLGSTGAVEREFPSFTSNDSYLQPFDNDNDGQMELAFSRFSFASPLCTGYDWKPSGYATLFSHADAIEGMGNVRLRAVDSFELVELAPNDLRVRALSGVVLFRASTDLAGWSGTNRDMQVLDVDGDGVPELLAIDAGAVRLVRYTGTLAVADPGVGGRLQLLGSAPNPFRGTMAFRFTTPAAGRVAIRVFDASGRLVRRLDARSGAGPQELQWDGRDEQGRSVPSGMLFYEVTANGARQSGRMLRLGH